MASNVGNGVSTNGRSVELNDPKYKKYALAVEKCLTTFDNVHEWADFISFLTKLLKTFQTFMQFKEIPRKLLVAKRLSQCLNPALPNGVHQRALDVYSHVLAVIGPDGLRRDLALWSSGLFPFFEYAAISVKPTLLNLYETHYIPLQQGLRPVMKAFILALLPGVEEETGEFFDKVMSILDKLSQTVFSAFFFKNMWLVLMTTPTARGPAINYLSRRLPRPTDGEDIVALLGGDVGLVIRAFAMTLEDEHLLVKRGILDLINQSLKMDGLVLQKASPEDRKLLMNAAVGVVLRRDVSLNRRVNAWLLGSLDESSEVRTAFYKTHSLQLLASTLRTEMLTPSAESGNTRPYKILISLLDTWEIGSALTEELIIDALSIAHPSIKTLTVDGDDEMILATAGVLERAEPRLVWKHILTSTVDGITGNVFPSKVLGALNFVFMSIKNHDEEVLKIHIPIFATNVLNALALTLRHDPAKASQPWVLQLMSLISASFQLIPSTAILDWQLVASEVELSLVPSSRAKQIYSLDSELPDSAVLELGGHPTPLRVAWKCLTDLTVQCVTILASTPDRSARLGLLTSVASALNLLVQRVRPKINTSTSLEWDPENWASSMLDCLAIDPPFELVDEVITLIIALRGFTHLEPSFSLGGRAMLRKLLVPIFRYLEPDRSPYHNRTVQLFWALHACMPSREIETLVSESMFSSGMTIDANAVDAFGVLWRFSDDAALPGFRLRIPLLAVLDALKSDNPAFRRAGETWMRSSLKSYVRVLDPIIFDLVTSPVARTPFLVAYQGRSVRGFQYVRPFDQKAIHYYLESLLAVMRFGGQGFVRIARTTPFNRTLYPLLYSAAEAANVAHATSTYLDVLMDMFLLLLLSEPIQELASTMTVNNLRIQGTVLELLQGIVARGELDSVTLETTESAIVGRLYAAVHASKLDLQNKLLHVLHSVLFATSTTSTTRKTSDSDAFNRAHRSSSNPLFVQVLIDGISRSTNRPVLQHWIDFVMMTVTQFRSLSHAVSPLCDCICKQLRVFFTELDDMLRHKGDHKAQVRWSLSDSDVLLLLNALERLVLLSVSKSDESSASEEESALEKVQNETSTGILGYVFGSDNQQHNEDDLPSSRSFTPKTLQEAVRTVHSLWSILGGTGGPEMSKFRNAFEPVAARVRTKCMKTLEHLFKVQPSEVLESLIECWLLSTTSQSTLDFKTSSINAIDLLTVSAQIVVQMSCTSITSRVTTPSRGKKSSLNPILTDGDILNFLEAYFRRLEGPISVQIWPTFASLAKELSNGQEYKNQMFPLLRCTTVLCGKLSLTTAFDDRRSRKELQDTFSKLLDNCTLIAGRAFDQGNWLRKGLREKEAVDSGRNSPEPSEADRQDEKNTTTTPADVAKTGAADVVEQINRYLALECLPVTKRVLVESDKVASVCSNIVYYIVAPAMKSRKTALADNSVMGILAELTKIPAAAKYWKPIVSEALNDNRFFNSSPAASLNWKPLIKALVETDKQSVTDLLARMTAAPSTNIFASRETEMLLRSLSLRRLSYVVYTGERNQFLAQLPAIQERLVDVLRPGVVAPIVHSEVYLCMRVLLCRLSPHNLSSFWPVILTELFRVFQQVLVTPPSDKSDDLQLVLSTCKFLDLLVTLQTEEFQVHQWIFITDTVDAVYRADNSKPESLMDLLTEATSTVPDARNSSNAPLDDTSWRDSSMRRPMLRSVRQISSVKDLIPFFSRVSLYAYETTYAGGLIDWEAVEQGLLDDLFDEH